LKKRELTFITTALILGAIMGGLIGDVIGSYLPPGGPKDLFSKSYQIGFGPSRVDFWALSFTIGLTFKVNFISVLVVLLVIAYFRWWYL